MSYIHKLLNVIIIVLFIAILIVVNTYGIDSCSRCDFSVRETMDDFFDMCVNHQEDSLNLSVPHLQTGDIPE